MTILKEFISKLDGPRPKIAVIGDAMLDQYYNVQVKKISPEFPIPVMQSETDSPENLPGGAANVAYQLKNFPVDVKLISFLDAESQQCFQNHGIDTSLSALPLGAKIPRKKRFYSNGFPTYRWDVELPFYGIHLNDLNRGCYELYQKVLTEKFDAIIFSDYDKGIFSSQYMEMLIPETPISVVDPKKNLQRWRGCTVLKPNGAESLLLSEKYKDFTPSFYNLGNAGLNLRDKLQCKVVITNGGEGVIVVEKKCIQEIRPMKTIQPPESVIGAGDCFVAFLTLAIYHGLELRDAAEVAWEAGCLYVQSRRNKPLHPQDLIRRYDPSFGKICQKVPQNLEGKVVFTNGCFDLLHAGHIETLKFAKSKGDTLVVGVNTDESVAKIKPGRPYVKLADRMALLASLEFVDYVIPFSEDKPLNLIKEVNPHVLVKGGDYRKEDVVGADMVMEVCIAPTVEGLSTTNLAKKIKPDG